MLRREFVRGASDAAAAACSGTRWAALSCAAPAESSAGQPFHLKFAPHFGMFAQLGGPDLVDQLKFAADQGFRAWEDNTMRTRPVADQERIAQAMEKLHIEMGTISALNKFGYELHFAGDDQATRSKVLDEIKLAIEVARRVRAGWMTLLLGALDPKLPLDYQTANTYDLLARACDLVEPHGITLVLEPLNRSTNHPGVFLHTCSQGYAICRAVRRKSCKVLFDIYHEQIDEGNLIPNIDRAWDEIGYVQCADNPGRKEPGTGEINYRTIFRHLRDKGWQGIVGLEHGNSIRGADGERAVIAAYREIDPK